MLSTSPMNNVPGWHHFNSILLTINIIQTPTKSHNLLCNILSQITFSNVHIHTITLRLPNRKPYGQLMRDLMCNQFAIFNASWSLDLQKDKGALPQLCCFSGQRTAYCFSSGQLGFNSCQHYTTYPSNSIHHLALTVIFNKSNNFHFVICKVTCT